MGTADFDGDGKPDLVWQKDTTRQVTVWFMGEGDGATFLTWACLNSGHSVGWRAIK